MVRIVPSTWEMLAKHPTTFVKELRKHFSIYRRERGAAGVVQEGVEEHSHVHRALAFLRDRLRNLG